MWHQKFEIVICSVQDGYMRTVAKSDLVDCLENLAAAHLSDNTLAVQAMVIDIATAANMLKPGPVAKSDLVDCLENLAAAHLSDNTLAVQAMVIDIATAANMLKPGPATKIFLDFDNQRFLTKIKSHLQH